MKLYQSPASPYARKCVAFAIECGIEKRLELVQQAPRDDAGGYLGKNPLARIPALELDDGQVLFDSPVICEYLDTLHDSRKLFPAAGPVRIAALKRQALGDGIMDAAVPLRQETMRPDSEQSPDFIQRSRANIRRAVAYLNAMAKAGALPGEADIGTLSIACALGYLDFRFADLEWRKEAGALAGWQRDFARRPAIADTEPA